MNPLSLNSHERRSVLALASVFSFRLLGLFIILPIFSPYLHKLPGATEALIGLAIGIYGLTQVCLQIPFGILSDYFGRKNLIYCGLLIFALGSIITASAHSIQLIILGRALQGAGAISGVVLALLADLTRDSVRTKAMAMLGMSIGATFALAFVLGPLLNQWISISNIFYLMAGCSFLIIFIVWKIVPTPPRICDLNTKLEFSHLGAIFTNRSLLQVNFSIFVLHFLLTANFFVIPLLLQNYLQLTKISQSLIYLGVFVLAVIFMIPMIIWAEKKRQLKSALLFSICSLLVSQIILFLLPHSLLSICVGLIIFFTAFNILEASLPSLISKLAPAGKKGSAMGIYSSCQFLGPALGGSVAGLLSSYYGWSSIFILGAGLAALWFLSLWSFKEPPAWTNLTVNISKLSNLDPDGIVSYLSAIRGVKEVVVFYEESKAYLKIDPSLIDGSNLAALQNM